MIQKPGQLYSLYSCSNYFYKLRVNSAKQLQSTLTSQQCHVLFFVHSQILMKNEILTILLIVLTCKCVCNHEHMMVTLIPLDVVIQ